MEKDEFTQTAYPVMVLRALETGYKEYDDIQKYILGQYSKYISTKTIYRHIKLIESLGFKIIDKSPYVIWPGDRKPIVSDNKNFGNAAYPLMILVALQSECKFYEGIIEKVDLIYKTRIERKAIGRHLELLGEIGYHIFHPIFYFSYQLGGRERSTYSFRET
jgi:hypothetical protein